MSANFYPWFFPWLVENWEKEPEKAQRLQHFLVVAEGIVKQSYPASAKAYLATVYDLPISSKCRNGSVFPGHIPESFEKLKSLHAMMLDMCKEMGIAPVTPSIGGAASGHAAKRAKQG